jgi:hypothetical protein
MGNNYLIAGLALCVTGVAITTLRLSGRSTLFGRLLVFGGLGLVAVWLVFALSLV